MAVRPSRYGAAMHSLMYPSIDLDDASASELPTVTTHRT
ncbi:Uncharacterised protein [Mycobacterium tuberculosis]|nr:Uncharacterised protein [Mycobacterium tuberculosis]